MEKLRSIGKWITPRVTNLRQEMAELHKRNTGTGFGCRRCSEFISVPKTYWPSVIFCFSVPQLVLSIMRTKSRIHSAGASFPFDSFHWRLIYIRDFWHQSYLRSQSSPREWMMLSISVGASVKRFVCETVQRWKIWNVFGIFGTCTDELTVDVVNNRTARINNKAGYIILSYVPGCVSNLHYFLLYATFFQWIASHNIQKKAQWMTLWLTIKRVIYLRLF